MSVLSLEGFDLLKDNYNADREGDFFGIHEAVEDVEEYEEKYVNSLLFPTTIPHILSGICQISSRVLRPAAVVICRHLLDLSEHPSRGRNSDQALLHRPNLRPISLLEPAFGPPNQHLTLLQTALVQAGGPS